MIAVPCWVTLEGAANVRDLGGLPAAGGLQVRPGRVLRADSLHLLDTLGVADEAIVADYAATDERRKRFGQLVASETAALGYSPADLTKINPDLTRAPAGQMAAFRSRWGGGADFLRAAGVSEDQVAALRSHLLEPRA